MRRTLLFAALILTGAAPLGLLAQSQAPILYKVTFPEPEHHWMQVEITLTSLGPKPLVAKPYTLKDLRDLLATLIGNRTFADDFFDKYVEGRETPAYARLLALAGYSLEMAPAGKGWLGNAAVIETPGGLVVGPGGPTGGGPPRSSPVPFNTPLYDAGIDSGDTVKTIDGQPATASAWTAIANKKPGDRVALGVVRRGGETIARTITVKQDPTARQVGAMDSLSAAQQAFRDGWLAAKVR